MRQSQAQKNFCDTIRPGTFIIGKWKQQRYLVKRKLGAGAIGSVYLCDCNGQDVALKISNQSSSITIEVNVLKNLKQVQGIRLGPYLLDVDDWQTSHGNFSFYVMEYLRGNDLSTFVKANGEEWIGVFLVQLLNDLVKLHEAGWVFGDLKIDNLVVLQPASKVRWVDVGGTTKIGRSIKEFTEFYDRGYWGLGSRKAEPSYDLFALVMVFLAIYYPKHFSKVNNLKQERVIFAKMDQIHALKPYKPFFQKAILGRYQTSKDMLVDVTRMIYSRRNRRQQKKASQFRQKIPSFIESTGILIVAIMYYLLSMFIL